MKVLFILTLCCSFCFATGSNQESGNFIENKNQWPSQVLFMTESGSLQTFIEKNGFTHRLWDANDLLLLHNSGVTRDLKTQEVVKSHVFKTEWLGANFNSYQPKLQQPAYYNYFLGNQSTWSSAVNSYGSVDFFNVYPLTDVKLYSVKGCLKYDIVLHPGASIEQIKLQFKHVDGLKVTNGKLAIHTSAGTITEQIPEAYQMVEGKKIKLQCFYILGEQNRVSFKIAGNVNPLYDVIIDPVLVISSYSGTQSYSFGLGAIPDEKGNIYSYGLNLTKFYPATAGAVQTMFNGGSLDAVISKFNSEGTAKIFSTFIGGNKNEYIINCQVVGSELAIFGRTNSDTFPVIKNGFMNKPGGYTDYFVVKTDTSGKTLLAGTYVGGSRNEAASSAAVSIVLQNKFYGLTPEYGKMIMDKNGEVYFTGSTYSCNYPVTPGAIKQFCDSSNYGEMVVTKLNKTLSQVVWSTYLGSDFGDAGGSITLGSNGSVYCAGNTTGNNFQTTPGVIFPSKIKPTDMVIVKLNASNGMLQASTYLGFNGQDGVMDIALDNQNNVYVAGINNYPVSVTVTPGTYNSTNGNIIFYKISPNLDQLYKVARFGNLSNVFNLEIDAFNVDSCGNIYFGGFGGTGLPTTSDALKTSAAEADIYVGVFNPDFSSLKYATYYGGGDVDHDDGGFSYFDKRGVFYHGICTNKQFPVTSGAYSQFAVIDTVQVGVNDPQFSDAFMKMDIKTFVNASSSLGGELRSCKDPITATFIAATNQGTVSIVVGDGSPAVYTNSLVHTYNNYGIYTAYVIAEGDTNTCNHSDTIRTLIKYGPPPADALADSTNNCFGVTDALDAGNYGSVYLWSTGDSKQIISPYSSGIYYVSIDNGYCAITDSSYITMLDAQYPMILPNIITPNGDGVNDFWDFSKYSVADLDFTVYNRWGTPVFNTNDGQSKWGGLTRQGQALSDGTYFWVIKYRSNCKPKEIVQQKGFIQIAR